MRVTRHAYEIEGWGVGELWVGDGQVVVAHDPPRRPAACRKRAPGAPRVSLLTRYRRSAQDRTASCPNCSQSDPQLLRGRAASRFADVPLDGDWGDAVPGGARGGAPACPVGRGRQLRRARRRWRAGRGRRVPPARSAPRTASRSSSPAIASSPVARDRRLRPARASTTSAGCSAWRAWRRLDRPLSERPPRRSSRAIAPERGCCRLAEISALFHSAGSDPSARPRRDLRCTSTSRRSGSRPPRLLAPARARDPLRDPHVQPPVVRPRDPLPAPRQRRRGRAGAARRGGRARRPARAARASAEAGRRPCLLPRRLPPRSAPRRRLALGAARAASRAADDLARGGRVPAHRRGCGRMRSSASSTAAATPSPTPRARRDRGAARARRARADTVLAFEERSVIAAAA